VSSGAEKIQARACVVGGGPAGMVLGFLLARAGVDVVVLEKHADFLRDFRGDTIHPSTLELLDELGLLAAFLEPGRVRRRRTVIQYKSVRRRRNLRLVEIRSAAHSGGQRRAIAVGLVNTNVCVPFISSCRNIV